MHIEKFQVKRTKTIRRQWKRDIVDTFTHPFCENGHIWTKETRFSTVRREDWYWKPEGSLFCGLVWCLGVGPLLCRYDGDILPGLKGGLERYSLIAPLVDPCSGSEGHFNGGWTGAWVTLFARLFSRPSDGIWGTFSQGRKGGLSNILWSPL